MSQQKNREKLSILSQRLRSRMLRLNLQANEIAASLGVSVSALSNWMNGKNLVKGKNLRRLAELLRCDPLWLLGDREQSQGMHELQEAPVRYGPDWERRAVLAEQKIVTIRAGLLTLLKLAETPTSAGADAAKLEDFVLEYSRRSVSAAGATKGSSPESSLTQPVGPHSTPGQKPGTHSPKKPGS